MSIYIWNRWCETIVAPEDATSIHKQRMQLKLTPGSCRLPPGAAELLPLTWRGRELSKAVHVIRRKSTRINLIRLNRCINNKVSLRSCTQHPNVKRDFQTVRLRICVFFFCQQKVTKGARHKIVISILKLKERQHLLRSLEKVSVQQSPSSTQKKTDLFWFHISF